MKFYEKRREGKVLFEKGGEEEKNFFEKKQNVRKPYDRYETKDRTRIGAQKARPYFLSARTPLPRTKEALLFPCEDILWLLSGNVSIVSLSFFFSFYIFC